LGGSYRKREDGGLEEMSAPMPQERRRKVRHLRNLEEAGAATREQLACNVGAGRVAEVREVDKNYRFKAPGVPQPTDGEITTQQFTTSSQLLTLGDLEASVEKAIRRRAAMGSGDVEVTISGRKILLTDQVIRVHS